LALDLCLVFVLTGKIAYTLFLWLPDE